MRVERLEAADLVDKACSQLGYDLSKLLALVSVWIDPKIVEMLASAGGVWYPQHRRANLGLRFEGKPLEKVGQVIEGIILDDNTYANTCFKRALGIHRRQITGFHVCHIWPGTAYDPRCFTQLANLVAIPRELSSLTDHHPHIVASLKFRSWELYRWKPDKDLLPVEPVNYPKTWRPPFSLNEDARRSVLRRLRGAADPMQADRPVSNAPFLQRPQNKRGKLCSGSAAFGMLLKSNGFVDVVPIGKQVVAAKDGKPYRFSIRTSTFSDKRNGWSYTFYDTSDRFDDATHLVGLMLSDADPGVLRDELFVISPKDLQEQFKGRKTWYERMGCNRFDVTIPRGVAGKWDKWITCLADIRASGHYAEVDA
jgi:hypothetical protein